MDETVTISKKEYERLKSREYELICLEEGGVDNWEWYSESLDPWYRKYHPENYLEELDDD